MGTLNSLLLGKGVWPIAEIFKSQVEGRFAILSMVGCDVDALAGNIKKMLLWTTKEFLVMQKKKTQTWLISMLSIFMNEGGSWRKEEQSWSSHQVQKGEQQHQEGYEGKENWIKEQFLKIDGIEWQEKRRTSFWSSSLQQVYRKLSLKTAVVTSQTARLC